jgi:ferredoxin-type protein NapH
MDAKSKVQLRKRLLFFVAGMVLFVAPFAVVMTALGGLVSSCGLEVGATMAQSDPTIHRGMCLRMPLVWAVWQQDSFLSRMVDNPLYGLVFILIILAVFIGPVFCGWLCPGVMTEHLSRLIPSRLKINLRGAVDPVPIRYGFLAGFFLMAAPFVKKSVCCSFCNWTWIENIWSALFGRVDGVTGQAMFAFSSSSIITFLLTFGFLGIFMEGGRGWCNFLCPAGALQNLAHWLGAKFRFTYKLLLSKDSCNDCYRCVGACPTWAILPSNNSISISRHICNGCKECIAACPTGALAYGRGEK